MILSIITINLNNHDGLQKTIESVINQTFRDFEWIVIDGGSSDGSRELIMRYSNHFAYWVSEPDKGIYNAMNKGTVMASGDYCLYLNSGDYLFKPTTLEDVFSNNHSEDIIWGRILYTISKEAAFETGIDNLNFSAFELFKQSLPHQACFIKRNFLIASNLYDESYKIVSDLKFFFKSIISEKASLAHINMIVSVVDGAGVSSDLEKSRIEEDVLFCEFLPSRLLNDYHEWLRLKDVEESFRQTMNNYHNAIALYDSVKRHAFLRKLHTLCYKLLCKQ